MNNEELIKEINILKEELEKTKNELVETKEYLEKYRKQIIAYIAKELKGTVDNMNDYELNFELQHPSDEQLFQSVHIASPFSETNQVQLKCPIQVNHLDNPDCIYYDLYDDDNLSQKDSEPYSDSSDYY